MTTTITSDTLPDQRDTLIKRQGVLAEKVQGLRAERTKAVLQGDKFSSSALRTAEEEHDAVSQAVADLDNEAARQAQEAAEKEQIANERRLRKRIEDYSAARLEAIGAAETAARAFADACGRAEETRLELADAVFKAFGTMPTELTPLSQEDRLSRGLTALLVGQLGKFTFGDSVMRPGLRQDQTAEPWAVFEHPITTEINRLLKGPEADGQHS